MVGRDMKRAAAAIVLLGTTILPIFSRGAASELLQLSQTDNGRLVAASVGSEIAVTLQTIGFGHYGTPSVSGTAVQFIGMGASPGPPNPGGPVQLFRFMARTAGLAQIAIPFAGGMGPNASTPPFRLTVQVN